MCLELLYVRNLICKILNDRNCLEPLGNKIKAVLKYFFAMKILKKVIDIIV